MIDRAFPHPLDADYQPRPKSEDLIGPPAPVVPPKSVASSALMLVVAIMSCLACLTLGAVTMVRDAADAWSSDVDREITIEISASASDTMQEQAARAADIAAATPGVGSIRVVDQATTAELLAPWLGQDVSLEELPVPTLIAIQIDDYRAFNMEVLKATLRDAAPDARVDDHRIWTDHLASMAAGTVAIGIGILVLVLSATVLCVVFATRAAMAGNKDVVEVLHYVGAGHRFIAQEFQRHFLLLGLKGGMIGGAAAMIAFLIFTLLGKTGTEGTGADQVRALLGYPEVGPAGYLGILAVVGLIALLTAATSRITVQNYLKG